MASRTLFSKNLNENQYESDSRFLSFTQKMGKQTSTTFKGFKQHFSGSNSGDKNSVSTNISKDLCILESKKMEICPPSTRINYDNDEEDSSVEEKRGFVPSDIKDPKKKEFLTKLSESIFTETKKKNLLTKLRVLHHLLVKHLILIQIFAFCNKYVLPYSDHLGTHFHILELCVVFTFKIVHAQGQPIYLLLI